MKSFLRKIGYWATGFFLIATAQASVTAADTGPSPATVSVPKGESVSEESVAEYTITAARLPGYSRPLNQTGANVTVITREEISRSGAVTLPQILQDRAGFVVFDENGNEYEGKTSLRGFRSGNDLVVVVDGIRVNDPNGNAVAWNLIPLERIEKIEIIRGGSTSLYGPHALSGVIQIWTREGTEEKGSIELGYGSHAEQHLNASWETLQDDWDFSGGAELRKGKGYRVNSDIRYADLFGTLGLTRGSGRYTLQIQRHEDRLGRAGELTNGEMNGDRRTTVKPDDYGDFEQTRAVLGYERELFSGAFQAKGAYRERDRITNSTSRFFGSTLTTDELASYSVIAQWSRSFGPHGFTLLFDGAEKRTDVLQQSVPTLAVTTNRTIEEKTRSGAARLDLSLGHDVTLTGTARFDRFEISNRDNRGDTTADGTRTFDAWSPGVSLVYHPSGLGPDGRLFVSASRTFRPPNIFQLFAFPAFGSNPNLDAEKLETIEAGLFLGGEKWKGGVTAFQMDLKNEIQFDFAANLNRNVGKTRRRGIETELDWHPLDHFRLHGEYTWLDAKVKSNPVATTTEGKRIPQVPRFSSATTLTYENGPIRTDLTHRHVSSRPLDFDSDNNRPFLPAYDVFDLGLHYSLHDRWKFQAHIFNLFDEKYITRGIDAGGDFFDPAPERSFYVSIGTTF
ncbi:MAG: TonB-dependent receptor [Candidatus Hydrogenedentota bacterium]|nr:MAG: TonB-dependent receptor [Candidatus Hydrogenedentota bacterium]